MAQRVSCPKCRSEVAVPPDARRVTCTSCGHGFDFSALPTEPGGYEPTLMDAGAAKAAPPEKLGKYDVLGEISRGGMGIIYRARQPDLDRVVALKVISPSLVTDQHFVDRFLQEARALGRLNHANIVHVYDVERAGDQLFIVMEYVEGTSLRGVLRQGKVAPEEATRILAAVCDALDYAHGMGIVHRDIKPENVLISRKGEVKLADFGLAVLMSGTDRRLTATDAVMGTLDYMAPEQRRGTKNVDHRADVYAIGVMLYEMLTGEVPMGRFDPPSVKAGVDRRFDPIVLRALEQEPDQRYQRASEIRSRLTRLSSQPSVPQPVQPAPVPASLPAPPRPAAYAPPPQPVTVAPPSPRKSNALLWILLGVGVFIMLACGGCAVLAIVAGSGPEFQNSRLLRDGHLDGRYSSA